jgi:hypothetical protein
MPWGTPSTTMKGRKGGREERERVSNPMNRLNLPTPLVWNIWIFNLNSPNSRNQHSGKESWMGAWNTAAVGSDRVRWTLSSQRAARGTRSLRGRKRETGWGNVRKRGDSKKLPIVILPRAPGRCSACSKTHLCTACNKLPIPGFKYQNYLKL